MSRTVKSRLDFFDRLDALRSDERFTNGHSTLAVRNFIETYWWCRWHSDSHDEAWERLCTPGVLARAYGRGQTRDKVSVQIAISRVYSDDAPRWEPETLDSWAGGCEHTLAAGPRKGDRCGRHASISGRINHPDGTWRIGQWCSTHRGEHASAWAESRRLAALDLPQPTPNRGGLLPVYIRANNWPDLYAAHSPGWAPPAVGINADDWPGMERVIAHAEPERPALRLIPGGVA
ncbi:hypothetical protein H9L10_03630 [Phycicoccus endophyticus]|uniref:Uncharacterized protein n=1 Tax=Phycicoccus endophyticus TaxID=1690220 RepID=A0A7G9R3I5_9MICO|nr:hypothetical protein [Phycicoccus endophyticus]NHI19916.1 hypothetical protein [Phycicoccus endophyticus]QNN50160.1 hypothetical protein H9L10_03630 [Phycicoccus endophyticus]